MFKKKTTKELVSGSNAGGVSETRESGIRKKPKKEKREKTELDIEHRARYAFFRTKTFFGIMAIVLALAIEFGGVPAMIRSATSTVEVACFARNVRAGEMITKDMLTSRAMSAYGLPENVVASNTDVVVGQYLLADAVAGDMLTATRISRSYPGDDPALLQLPEGKVAVSISLPDLAQSVSGKLRGGDVVQIYAIDDLADLQAAQMLPELQYVEVLCATYQNGQDVEQGSWDKSAESSVTVAQNNTLNTVTLLVSEQQAAVVAGYEHSATLHVALVVRGDANRKAAALAAQDAYLAQHITQQDAATATNAFEEVA